MDIFECLTATATNDGVLMVAIEELLTIASRELA